MAVNATSRDCNETEPQKKTGATRCRFLSCVADSFRRALGLAYQPKPTPTPPEVSLPLTAAPKVRFAFGDSWRE